MARTRIAFIGAGSFGFTRTLVKDILTFPILKDSTIVLMDINSERLGYITRAVKKIVAAGNYPANVISTTSRAEALKGADAVICTILSGGIDVWRYDILIPKKYGIDINVGDTRGPSGIFRALRTIPVMLDICKDIERYCPNAIFLKLHQSDGDALPCDAENLQGHSLRTMPQRPGNRRDAREMGGCATRGG